MVMILREDIADFDETMFSIVVNEVEDTQPFLTEFINELTVEQQATAIIVYTMIRNARKREGGGRYY